MKGWIFAGVMLILSVFCASPVQATPNPTSLLITEVQTAGATSAFKTHEFIEIYNQSNLPVELNDWKLEYLTASGTPSTLVAEDSMSGWLDGHSFLLLAREGYVLPGQNFTFEKGLSETGGSIRISDKEGNIDLVGWGDATVFEGRTVDSPAYGYSIKRTIDTDTARFIDTNNNSTDNYSTTPPSPAGSLLLDGVEPVVSAPSVPNAPSSNGCAAITVSEIMANPLGSDISSGAEYIELYNPSSEVVSLAGCSMKTNANSKVYTFTGDDQITPGQYLSFSGAKTELTLLNGGGVVTFMDSISETLFNYPLLGDDQSWSLMDEDWSVSDRATPDRANEVVLLSEETELCPAGKYRNPDSGRCKSYADSEELVPCDIGQTRSPETNRCRSLVSLAATLTPCQAGYERNASTNRCRKVASEASDLKACDPGYERNILTNRCRKVSGNTADAVESDQSQLSVAGQPIQGLQWWFLGALATGASGYGIYEWRFEIMKKIKGLAALFSKKS